MTGEFQDPWPAEPDLGGVIALSDQLIGEAVRILHMLSEVQHSIARVRTHRSLSHSIGPQNAPANDGELDRNLLRIQAMQLVLARRQREHFFAPAMFGELAWDMLLALYIHDWSDRRFTNSTLGTHLRASPSSVTRWLAYLERDELIVREDHPTDRRKSFIMISPKARQMLDRYLLRLASAAEHPQPAS